MPPHPLSKVVRNPTYDFTPAHIDQRPELAILMAQAIATAAVVETQWGRLLASMLGANAPPVIAMYQALSGGNAQRAALEAAAERVLSPEHKEMFDALALIARPLARMRNKLAHGSWGICHELPDALIHQDADSILWLHHEVDVYVRRIMTIPIAERTTVPEPKDDLSAMLVFRKRDFEQLNRELGRLRGFLGIFANLISRTQMMPARGGSLMAAIFQQLSAEPEIVKALTRLRKDRKKTPADPSRRSRKDRSRKS